MSFSTLSLYSLLALGSHPSPAPVLVEPDGVGVYVEPNNYTILRKDDGTQVAFHFGYSNCYDRSSIMIPFAHDANNDGYDSVGYYNRRENRFYLANENPDEHVDEIFFQPVPWGEEVIGAVWPLVLVNANNGDVDVGIFDTAHNRFYIQDDAGQLAFKWGGTGSYLPVVGDWNGDGVDSLGLYDPGPENPGWPAQPPTFRLNDHVPPQGISEIQIFGAYQTLPVIGDWDGDSTDDVGYFDVEERVFHRSGASNIAFTEAFLTNFDEWPEEAGVKPALLPLAGKWDESGEPEPAPYPWTVALADEIQSYGFDPQDLEDAIEAAADTPHLNSLIVIRDHHVKGYKIIKEAYYNGYTQNISHHMMSATKSVLSALFGVANLDGAISGNPGDPVGTLEAHLLSEMYPPSEYVVCGGAYINLLDVMTMSSGFLKNNDTWGPMFAYGDFVEWILNGPGTTACTSSNWWSHDKLGHFDYYGGNNHVGAEALRRYVEAHDPEHEDLFVFAQERLFERLDILPTRWDHEPSSNALPQALGKKVFYGPSQMFMRPRDMARFGQLYLEDGLLDGDQVLDPEWVAETTTDQAPDESAIYGCWWWCEYLNGDPMCFNGHCGYQALGFGGQQIFIFPTLDLLVVMTSNWLGIDDTQSGVQIGANDAIMRMILEALL